MNKEKFGIITIIGCANAGKSTLLNTFMGKKVSIVTHKRQTTQTQITSVFNNNNLQLLFIDTPGFHNSKKSFNKRVNKYTLKSLSDVNYAIYLFDANKPIFDDDKQLLKILSDRNVKIIYAINKIDLLSEQEILEKLLYYSRELGINNAVPISCKNNKNIDYLISIIEKKIGLAPHQFNDNYENDEYIIRERITEIIREKVYLFINEEIPYTTKIELESFELNKSEKCYKLLVYIICARQSHKSILIGAQAKTINAIKRQSLKDLKILLKTNVKLELIIKYRKKKW